MSVYAASSPNGRTAIPVEKKWDWQYLVARSPHHKTVKAVAQALSMHMNADGTSAFPGIATLMQETSCSERTVRRALHALVHGTDEVRTAFLKSRRRYDDTTIYDAVIEPLDTDRSSVTDRCHTDPKVGGRDTERSSVMTPSGHPRDTERSLVAPYQIKDQIPRTRSFQTKKNLKASVSTLRVSTALSNEQITEILHAYAAAFAKDGKILNDVEMRNAREMIVSLSKTVPADEVRGRAMLDAVDKMVGPTLV